MPAKMSWADPSILLAVLVLTVAAADSSFHGSPSEWTSQPDFAREERPSLLQIATSVPKSATHGECTFDQAGLDDVLRKFVKGPRTVDGIASTLFDYKALHDSSDYRMKLDEYVKSLAEFKPSCLSRDGKLAFWANAYNALVINLVMSNVQKNAGELPKSIRDLAGDASTVWSRKAGVVGGQAMTLEEVLSEGRKLGDPRIHAAVNCASLSCPDLRAGAYSAAQVHSEFDAQVEKWLRNSGKGAKVHGDTLQVSIILEWHAEDFPDVSSFVAGRLGLPSSSVKIKGYLPYSWALNCVK